MKLLACGIFTLCVMKSVDADCDIMLKKDWGGKSPKHVQYLPRPVKLVVIQNTATPGCSSETSCKSRVQSEQDFDMNRMKQWDVKAGFLIGGTGQVYEGSGWLHVGSRAYGYTERSLAISFIGDFMDDEPTFESIGSALALLKCGVKMGHLSPDYKVVGLKQLVSMTESPGRLLYKEMQSWPHWQENVDDIKMI